MKRLILILTAVALAFSSCHRLDDKRIPPAPVNIVFYSVADWNTYGLKGAMDHKRFILSGGERVPSNFPYNALSYTGFGGILLVEDAYGNIIPYDLACPVECRANVRVKVDAEALDAECPVCHSTYDIFSLYGHPKSGPAAEKGYGLRRYTAAPGRNGEYMVVYN